MLPHLQKARRTGALVYIPDGRLIISGGFDGTADVSINHVECFSFDAPHRGWRTIAPLPQPISAIDAVYFHDFVLIAGGQDAAQNILRTVYALKPPPKNAESGGVGQWTRLSAQLPRPAWVDCICRAGDELFAFGEFCYITIIS